MPWLLMVMVFPCVMHAQSILQLDHVTDLATNLNETSALQLIESSCWTLGDSGYPSELYQLDTLTGQVLRTVAIQNAVNVDWEEIAATNEWTYIGDFGNNNGDRMDQRIYRVSTDSLSDPTVTSISAGVIQFSYADQSDFSTQPQATPFDMEAMVAYRDSLFLFTKDWVQQRTKVYRLSRHPGVHIAIPIDSIPMNGLITGADVDTTTGTLVLLGHAFGLPLNAFLIEMDLNTSSQFSTMTTTRYAIQPGDHQMEGVAIVTGHRVWITNEEFFGTPASLWKSTYALSIEDPIGNGVPDDLGAPFLVTDLLGRPIIATNAFVGISINYYQFNGRVIVKKQGFIPE